MEHIIKKIRNHYIPTHVQIELTKRCNLHCNFCYAECDSYDGLDQQIIFELLRDLKKLGTLEINFTGGEPLLRKNAFEIFEYAKSLGFSLTLNTNATLITNDNCEKLLAMFSKFEISLHSIMEDKQDSITNIKGSYLKVMDALQLLSVTPEKVLIKCVLTNQTVCDWKKLYEFCKKKGFDCSFDMLITSTYSGNSDAKKKYQVSNDQMHEIVNDNPELSYRVGKDIIADHMLKGKLSDGICSAARTSVFIDAEGYCYPCVVFKTVPTIKYKGKEWCESICKKSFIDIWKNNIFFNAIRNISPDYFKKCLNCNIDKFCIKCMAKNWLETGELYIPSCDYCKLSHAKYSNPITYSIV